MNEIKLRDYQVDGVEGIRRAFSMRLMQALFVLPTGGGKCLGKGTPILMFSGEIKRVEDISIGDLLMGPDSKPRKVISLSRGREPLYKVTPKKGDSYIVNESHILSLKRTNERKNPIYPCQMKAGEIVNLSVLDYLKSSNNFRHIHKGWRSSVDFAAYDEAPLIEPYFFGLWLGDGHSNIATITTSDDEITQYLIDFSRRHDFNLAWHDNSELSICIKIQEHSHKGRGRNRIMNALRKYDVIRNKHIPHRYKTGSRAERLQILAGIIDTDGHYTGKGYDLALKSERLLDDVIFIARSLGYSAYKSHQKKICTNNGVIGDYWRCNISGDIDEVPCLLKRKQAKPRLQKKSVLMTGIDVMPIGDGDYYGFEIDGDHLFMLGDFTVTHNTFTFCYISANAAAKGNNVVIIVHRKELLLQASKALRALGIDHGLISPHFTPAPERMVQVASIDTLLNRLKKNPDRYKFKLAIFDEAHHVTLKNKWGACFELLGRPTTLGVTATPIRSDGTGLGYGQGGIFKEMILGPSVAELIKMGSLINPTVYTSLEPPQFDDLKTNKEGEYNAKDVEARVDKPVITGSAVAHYAQICPRATAIVFCASVQHAKHVVAEFNAAGFKFALLVGEPAMSDGERTSVNQRLASGELHGACTVALVDEGYDLPALQCCIVLAPTASLGRFLQRVGRIMRPSPETGKSSENTFYLDHVGDVGRKVGDVFVRKHGLPSDFRDWSLEGRKKKSKKDGDEPSVQVKQCPKCYHIFVPADHCPKCGHDMRPAQRALEEIAGELTRITAEHESELQIKKREKIKQVAAARTLEELLVVEKDRGYKPGWAKHLFNSRKK